MSESGRELSYCVVAGGKVYMACRSVQRARIAADDIKHRTGVGDDRLIVMQLDLGSLSSVRSFASSFKTSSYHLCTVGCRLPSPKAYGAPLKCFLLPKKL